ncbi:hypothetical protein C8034_v006418 [Colletotrichum sidae]|uniref:Heterokaryon incompatibility domain-containing protein n=1 Tax=Colletotrichum sidae TaxID=1347389 RepID=A0A4R8T3A4_9PEZI|nr:hypothetical protein C8034_v006418 [Colletotrichum sidae]
MRDWLFDCDELHSECAPTKDDELPTRLICVGTERKPLLHLVETSATNIEDKKYVALSHRWGETGTRHFVTHLRDEQGHDLESFKRSIPYSEVPQTFKDAIKVTRKLGISYLWIDSLCIIQGEGGDFGTEAKRMEDVFSCAYCVIAASRAANQAAGFLGKRPGTPRQFVTLKQENAAPIYVCEGIDDFEKDVLKGSLNRRGWVLQERALARRTIYFTDSQMYFECGGGVRCETLTKMENNFEFLGDARFPNKAVKEQSRAVKIRYFQDLYRRYSELELTRIQDRPVAIAGLETRLRQGYSISGGYGIFDDGPDHGLFHRSLLWRRGKDINALKPIDFSSDPELAAPTWSWMAHEGGIDYLDPPYDKNIWSGTEIKAPWTTATEDSSGPRNTSHLQVVARSFDVSGGGSKDFSLIYDNPDRPAAFNKERTMCVVVARAKEGDLDKQKIHYVLLVEGVGGLEQQGRKVYGRVGVGSLLGKYIILSGEGTKGVVQ